MPDYRLRIGMKFKQQGRIWRSVDIQEMVYSKPNNFVWLADRLYSWAF